MGLTLYTMSGSPYGWRVALALEHKGLAYELKMLSYDAGDLRRPDFVALNPRGRVPVLVDDGFALYESAAIVEYLEDKAPQAPRLFAADLRQRATQRRMVREADQYFSTALEHFIAEALFTPKPKQSREHIAEACADMQKELAVWEKRIAGDYLAGELSAVDFTLFPQVALVRRIGQRDPGTVPKDLTGPAIAAWMGRMYALPITRKTWPPHWLA